MKFFSFLAKAVCEVARFCKSVIKFCAFAGLALFTLTVFMPENMQTALEIFKNLL